MIVFKVQYNGCTRRRSFATPVSGVDVLEWASMGRMDVEVCKEDGVEFKCAGDVEMLLNGSKAKSIKLQVRDIVRGKGELKAPHVGDNVEQSDIKKEVVIEDIVISEDDEDRLKMEMEEREGGCNEHTVESPQLIPPVTCCNENIEGEVKVPPLDSSTEITALKAEIESLTRTIADLKSLIQPCPSCSSKSVSITVSSSCSNTHSSGLGIQEASPSCLFGSTLDVEASHIEVPNSDGYLNVSKALMLRDMGFEDDDLNRKTLNKHKGDIDAAMEELMSMSMMKMLV